MNTFWVLMVLRLAAAKMDPGSYAPKTNQQCPQTLLRQSPALNQTLNPNEAAYEAERRKSFPDAWREWVGDGSNLGYDLDKLGITANNGSGLPVIAIAASGGGYRSVYQSISMQTPRHLTGIFAVHHKTVLVWYLLSMHAIGPQRQRVRVGCCK